MFCGGKTYTFNWIYNFVRTVLKVDRNLTNCAIRKMSQLNKGLPFSGWEGGVINLLNLLCLLYVLIIKDFANYLTLLQLHAELSTIVQCYVKKKLNWICLLSIGQIYDHQLPRDLKNFSYGDQFSASKSPSFDGIYRDPIPNFRFLYRFFYEICVFFLRSFEKKGCFAIRW